MFFARRNTSNMKRTRSSSFNVTMDTDKSLKKPLALPCSEDHNVTEGKEKYKELKELLLLHRRYELEALRNLRKGVSVESDQSIPAPGKGNPREQSRTTRSAILQRRKLSGAYNHDYMRSLCASNNSPAVDEDQQQSYTHPLQISRSTLSSSALSHASSSTRSSVRLPSLEARSLPRKRSYPQRRAGDSHRRKDFVRELNPPVQASQMCLKVQSLSLVDQEDGSDVPEESSDVNPDQDFHSMMWLVPWSSHSIPEITSSSRLPKQEKQSLSTSKNEKGKSKEKGKIKYKKNVQFDAEAIHEIHLYSPMPVK